MTRAARRGGAAALLLTLGACGLFDAEQARLCPDAAILADAKRITLYRTGPGRDLTDVEFEGEIARIAGSCKYGRRELAVVLTADIVAVRGPAASAAQISLPFFVAVTDAERNVVAKQVFDTVIPIPPDRRGAAVREEIEHIIPLRQGETPPYYEIIVGFQLTPEQLEQNRRARGQ